MKNSLGCTGHDDYKCLCAEEAYTDQLSSCINATCFPQDQTIARDSYTSECQVRALGLLSATTTTERRGRATVTASASSGENENDDQGNDGPNIETVVGIVAGVIAGLASLVIAGYFTFRKRSTKFTSDMKTSSRSGKISRLWKSLICSSEEPVTPSSSNGMQSPFEMSGLQQLQPSLATLPTVSANTVNHNGLYEMECQFTFQRQQQEQEERPLTNVRIGIRSSNYSRRTSIPNTL